MNNRPPSGSPTPETTLRLLTTFSHIWGIPTLVSYAHILTSPRMTRTLARAYPGTGIIRISTRVLDSGSEDLIREVLCHEAAHLACRLKYGKRVRPHGVEWQELMRQAGYEPRVRLNHEAAQSLPPPRRRPLLYHHHCPVCGWIRPGRTTNRRWRCATCVRAGRDGLLVVTRIVADQARERNSNADARHP